MVFERRRFKRFSLDLPVEIVRCKPETDSMENARVINISAGGAYFPFPYDIAPGEELRLRINSIGTELDIFPGYEGIPRNAGTSLETMATVLRAERRPEYPDACCLAVKFVGPLRFTRGK